MAAEFPKGEPQADADGATAEFVRLRAENERLQAELAASRQRQASRRAKIAAVKQRVQELERQLRLHG